MNKNKKFALVLFIVLIFAWVVNDLRQQTQGEFEKAFEFSFVKKTYQDIEDYLDREGERYSRSTSDTVQIASLVNMMECRYFLLYENQQSIKKYYDFIKVVICPDMRLELKNKKTYTDEIGKFIRRKRKLQIKYRKYEVSHPVFSKNGANEHAEVYLMRITEEDKEYIKYDFKKYTNGRYYLYLDNKIPLNQLHFRFKQKEKK